jgi:glutamyl-tRNA synthetase
MTHLIRGSDHVTNTVVQIQLFHALAPSKQGGVLFPQWAHFPLLGNMDGEKISKRNGGLTLQALRAQGILPLTLCHELASLGLSHRIDGSLQDMAKTFRLDEYGRNSPKLDFSQLLSHNQSLIQSLSYEDMLKSVYAMTSKPHGASCSHELWEVVRPNLSCLSELSHWIEVCLGSFSPLDPFLPPLEGVSIPKLLALCPKDPWDETTWDQWIQCILQTYPTLKKGTVNGWLRKKLTGKERGPKMGVLFPLLLPKKVHERLSL